MILQLNVFNTVTKENIIITKEVHSNNYDILREIGYNQSDLIDCTSIQSDLNFDQTFSSSFETIVGRIQNTSKIAYITKIF